MQVGNPADLAEGVVGTEAFGIGFDRRAGRSQGHIRARRMLDGQQPQERRQLGVGPAGRRRELVGRIAAPGVDQRDPTRRRRPRGRRQ